MQSPEVHVRVVLDATPLLGHRTGIGVFTQSLFEALSLSDALELSAFGMTGRNVFGLKRVLPHDVLHNRRPMPAGLLTRIWQYVSQPTLDAWMPEGDVVHGTNFVVPPTRKAAQLVTVHDLTAIRYPELCSKTSLRYPALVCAAVKRGAHVHTLSRSVASDVEELLGVSPERIHVIPPGLPKVEDTLAAVTPSAPYVFAIGTIEPRKDYPTLIEAFDILADNHPDVQLLIAGDRGWGSEAFDVALDRARHVNRIRVLGPVSNEQYRSFLRQASVLAFPSLYEGFGYPPLEAMREGVPVVATNVASLPEVCGDAAVLVEPRKPDVFAQALEQVLTDRVLRNELIRKGSLRAGTMQWDDAASRFVALYEELAT